MALIKPNYYFNNGFIFQNEEPLQQDNGIITVNYLLSTKCQLNCVYCIAQDIIRNYSTPTLEEVDKSIDTILKLDPLVTVLSGGEPLLSPHLKYVIEKLHRKTNIILDTNGILLQGEILDFLLEHKVNLRISMDFPSEINDTTRKGKRSPKTDEVLKSLECLKKKDYAYVISTVINNYNADELWYMLSALFTHSWVSGWRLQTIIPCHNINFSEYINDENGKPRCFINIKAQLIIWLLILKQTAPHHEFTMQINDGYPAYSTILLLPDGNISLSSKTQATREIIDVTELKNRMNEQSHQERYVLNRDLY